MVDVFRRGLREIGIALVGIPVAVLLIMWLIWPLTSIGLVLLFLMSLPVWTAWIWVPLLVVSNIVHAGVM